MKVSYNWLKEYVKLPKPEKLVDLLTMHSFEVKEIYPVKSSKAGEKQFNRVKKTGKDWIFDIDVLPNRAHDCLCHVGVARECAALLKLKIKDKKFQPKADPPRAGKAEDFIGIEIKNTDLCSRYCARVINGIKVGPSPKWLKEKLEAIGQQSINNVVDAANFVMFEIGQPLHAFDFDKISGVQNQKSKIKNQKYKSKIKNIIIRKAKKGEKIITLDGEKYDLDEDILVIADSKEPLAIAGIKGGKKAEISNKTKTIILESANFNLNNIHASSRKLGLQTEASLRFEHGLDPNLASEAIDRVAGLIRKVAGGKIAKNIVDVYPFKLKSRKISLKIAKINSVLGVEISEREAVRILNSLGFKTKIISPVEELIKLARSFIGRPYKYGASTSQEAPNVFDCSSLTRYLFRQIGKEIPRLSIEQIGVGQKVERDNLRVGDLVFSRGGGTPHYSKEFPRGIGHVGLYFGNGKIIHASGKRKKVVIETLRSFAKLTDWRGARRILEDYDDHLLVEIPTRRLDIEFPEDLIEEIGRIYGYEKIPSKPPLGILVPAKADDLLRLKNKIKDILEGLGMIEVYNYSFIGEKDLEKLGLDFKNYLELENPLSFDLKYLRRDLILGLLKNVRDNFRCFEEGRLFELGKVYLKDEKMMLTGVIWRKTNEQELFYEIKGLVDGLLNKLGIANQWYDDYKQTPEFGEKKLWHPTLSAEIKLDNQEIGFIGLIDHEPLSKLHIITPLAAVDPGDKTPIYKSVKVAAFNFDFELLIQLVEEELTYQHPSKYPAVVRDIAILVNLEDRVSDVLNAINSVGGKLVSDVDLFDMYEGEEIPEGKKNLAFHIIYQAEDRTLTDDEVDKVHNRIMRKISKRKGWEVRK